MIVLITVCTPPNTVPSSAASSSRPKLGRKAAASCPNLGRATQHFCDLDHIATLHVQLSCKEKLGVLKVDIMRRHWLDYDSVALATLLVGMIAIELLALII